MAQNYSELRKDNVRDAIYEDVANNLEVLRTSWAGNAFPENPKVGQACYRIDEDNLYFWDGTTWSQKGGGGIDMNTGDKLYDWIGTLAEYREQDIENQHPEYLCFITDDETPVICATRSLDNLDEVGQALLDAKADKTEIDSKVDTDASNFTAAGKETIVGWGMPDYTAGISLNTAVNVVQSAPTDGVLWVKEEGIEGVEVSLCNANGNVTFDKFIAVYAYSHSVQTCFGVVSKGQHFKITKTGANGFYFFPFKGVK